MKGFSVALAVVVATLWGVAIAAPVSAQDAGTPVGYPTRNGDRTADQLRLELTAAGYPGPWDVDSMLAAYARAAAPPTPVPLPAPRLDPLLASRCFQFAADLTAVMAPRLTPNQAANLLPSLDGVCRQDAVVDGSVGEQCFEWTMTRAFALSLEGAAATQSATDALYRMCMSR